MMVNQYGFVRVGVYFMVFLCSTLWPASTSIAAKPKSKRQTDSFLVSANYGVQSGNVNNPSVSQYRDAESLNSPLTFINFTGQADSSIKPTSSAWVGGNFASSPYEASFNPFQPHLVGSQHLQFSTTSDRHQDDIKNHSDTAQYMRQNGLGNFKTSTNSGEIIYGTVNPHTTVPTWKKEEEKPVKLRREFVTSDNHKPTISDLQEMISKIVKGGTRVHQVVKVPAVYEIHLQEEQNGMTQDDTKNFQEFHVPLPTERPKSQSILQPLNKPHYPRSIPHHTRTWNLPSKLKYFNKKPSALYYGGVNVPMTPGSTAVTLWNRGPQSRPNVYGTFQVGAPDLSWYYAKKKELENDAFQPRRRFVKPELRRKGYGGSRSVSYGVRSKRRDSRRMIGPFDGVSYIVHVREKSGR